MCVKMRWGGGGREQVLKYDELPAVLSPLFSAGVQANEQYGEQFVIMFTLIMTQLKMVGPIHRHTRVQLVL